MFSEKNPSADIYDDKREVDDFKFFSAYYKTYKATGNLITSQSDRKQFVEIMNRFFLDYFMASMVERVEKGENQKAVEKELEKTAAEYLPYIMVKKLVVKFGGIKLVK